MSTEKLATVDCTAQFFSARQLAARYDVSIATIWRWRREGAMPDGIRLSRGQTRWTADAIRAWEVSRPTVGDHPFASAKQKTATKRERTGTTAAANTAER